MVISSFTALRSFKRVSQKGVRPSPLPHAAAQNSFYYTLSYLKKRFVNVTLSLILKDYSARPAAHFVPLSEQLATPDSRHVVAESAYSNWLYGTIDGSGSGQRNFTRVWHTHNDCDHRAFMAAPIRLRRSCGSRSTGMHAEIAKAPSTAPSARTTGLLV